MAGRRCAGVGAGFAEVAGKAIGAETNNFAAAEIETFGSVLAWLAENRKMTQTVATLPFAANAVARADFISQSKSEIRISGVALEENLH